MFCVCVVSPLDEQWEERDKMIREAAGRRSLTTVTCCLSGEPPRREHHWRVATFGQAQAILRGLAEVASVKATLREE